MMSDELTMPAPSLASAFTLVCASATELVVGSLATGGERRCRVIAAGDFNGRDIVGTVRTGSEVLLARLDGVTVVEANYLIETADQSLVRLIGTGYLTETGPFAGTRMSVVFEVDEHNPLEWLSRRAFIAERALDSDTFDICEIC